MPGRFVAHLAYWPHWTSSPHKVLEDGITAGTYPPGTTIASWAEAGGGIGQPDHQWIGVRFPTAKAAKDWIAAQVQEDEEFECERFATKRELSDHLDEQSQMIFLGSVANERRPNKAHGGHQ